MEGRKGSAAGPAAGPAAVAESVAMSGRSRAVRGKRGETDETARIRTGRATPCRRATSMLVSTSAAAPSEVAQMSSSRSGSATTADAATCSAVTGVR